ncbi:hypothetical protein [Parapoynx stagnalis nucleopolyhedrovirus]|uniref:Uncharacterized protein n=1 Tax=Parapoynx stagnalis nucleopolyhedrovirus TaxID=2993413 RepID=A0A9E7Y5N8_9ABAC|nr:hypothetical protein [Parapoynx stagnalis nucleopolyhedrovirus]
MKKILNNMQKFVPSWKILPVTVFSYSFIFVLYLSPLLDKEEFIQYFQYWLLMSFSFNMLLNAPFMCGPLKNIIEEVDQVLYEFRMIHAMYFSNVLVTYVVYFNNPIANFVILDNAIYALIILLLLMEFLVLFGATLGVYKNYTYVKSMHLIGACLFLPVLSFLFTKMETIQTQLLNNLLSSVFFCVTFFVIAIFWNLQEKKRTEKNLQPLIPFENPPPSYTSI